MPVAPAPIELPTSLPVLNLSLSPMGETAVVLSRPSRLGSAATREVSSSLDMQIVDLTHITPGLFALSNLSTQKLPTGGSYLFGGRSFSNAGQLVVRGDNRIPESGEINSPNELFGTTGEFHLLEVEHNRVRLSADYFGVQQLFKYDDGNTFVAATSYHLLLRIVKSLGLNINIDYARSRRILDEGRVFHSRVAIDAEHCSILAIYEHVEIDTEGPRIIQTDLHDLLYKRRDFSEQKYASLISQARDEIVHNMQMVFESSDFEAVVVDLSGGMDSRLLYAACTQIPQALVRRKIQINCQHAPSPSAVRGGDLEVALEVNSIWNYPTVSNNYPERRWVNISSEAAPGTISINKISRNFGTHKNYNHITPRHVDQYCLNVARVSGFIGECYRSADSQNIRSGTSYINHRNRYMTSRAFENILSPLASKSALEAGLYYQRNHPESNILRTVFDILIALNPMLAMVRFHNESLREFVESDEFRSCLNFPRGLNVDVARVENPQPTNLARYEGEPQVEEFVFAEENVEAMMDRIISYNPAYSDIIARVDASTAARNNTTVYRLWNLYFAIDIAEGRG